MGRQINFYVDRQTELEILDFIKREGGKFMFDQSGEIVLATILINLEARKTAG